MPRNRDEEEIMGYRDALNTIHESYPHIPLRASCILQLHGVLCQYSEKGIGGRFRNTQNFICATDDKGISLVLFTPPAPYDTPAAMDTICDSLNRGLGAQSLDAPIPSFIHDFLRIHPFSDGNGRVSRLLTMLLLYRSGYMVGRYISLESKIARNEQLCYDSLDKSRIGWCGQRKIQSSSSSTCSGRMVYYTRSDAEKQSAVACSANRAEMRSVQIKSLLRNIHFK